MRDLEHAIDPAWDRCDWQKVPSSARCVIHSKWSTAERKMSNGQKFGSQRAEEWYRYMFATCAASFKDGIGTTAKLWRDKGDNVGADYLLELAATSSAPLHKWTPCPCPYVTSASGETLNQVMKQVTPGEKRKKMTFVQLIRRLIKTAYRSCALLHSGPLKSLTKSRQAEMKIRKSRGRVSPGKYTLLLGAVQQLTWRAFVTFRRHANSASKHTCIMGKWEVWSQYQELSAPDVKYRHLIEQSPTGSWRCIIARSGRPCWENKIRGLFCSHMCAYAEKLVTAGGEFDVRTIGKSSLARHRASNMIPKVPEIADPVPLLAKKAAV